MQVGATGTGDVGRIPAIDGGVLSRINDSRADYTVECDVKFES